MFNIKSFSPLWDKWEILEEIGSGLYGTVYKIRSVENGKEVFGAVKYIEVEVPDNTKKIEDVFEGNLTENSEVTETESDDEVSPKEKALNQILDEIETNYSFTRSKNLLIYEEHVVYENDDKQGYDIFIRMPYLESLSDILSKGELNTEEKLKLASDICSGLEDLEKRGIFHGDIKPNNIFKDDKGNYLLADFGISKKPDSVVNKRAVKETVAFMAPELQENKKAEKTADIYSLGLLLYTLFNGNREPFVKEDSTPEEKNEAILKRIKGVPFPAPSDADGEISKVILIACQFSPESRWMDASSFKNAVLSCKPGSDAGAIFPGKSNHSSEADSNNGDIFTDGNSNIIADDDNVISDDDALKGKDIDAFEDDEDNFDITEDSQDINSQATVAFTPGKEILDSGEEYYSEDEEIKSKGKGKTALIIIAIILVLGIIGGAVFFAINNDMFGGILPGANQETTEETTEETTQAPTPAPLTTAPPTEAPTKAPELVIVPNVAGMDYSRAMDEFAYAGLSVSIDYYAYSDYYDYNTVISVTPSEGESVQPGSTVSVVISLGSRPDETSAESNSSSSNSSEKSSDYVIDGTDSRYIDSSELEDMDERTLTLAVNELYARHGRIFTTPYIADYFNSKTWYSGTVSPSDFDESVFNKYERANKDTIVSVMEEKGYR